MMFPAPFVSAAMTVCGEWTDYNGHLNMAYYHVLFDTALDVVLPPLGLGAAVAGATGSSVFTAQAQVHYLRELNALDRVTVETRLIAHDAKRLHYVQTMRHADGWVAAINEAVLLHVDLTTRRVAPWPGTVASNIAAAVAAHAALPMPEQVGRRVSLTRN